MIGKPQIFFVTLILILAIYSLKWRKAYIDRIIIILLLFLGIFLVVFPNITVVIANFLGIGRGTDLVLYLFILFSIYMFINILSETRNFAIKFTQFIRKDAIANAKNLTKTDKKVKKEEIN